MNKPKILFWDIETAPIKAWIWRPGHKISVSHEQIVEGEKFKIICIAYKWAHEKTVKSLSFNLKTQDCSKLTEEFSKIIAQADVTIGHNADSFDQKHFNTHRLLNGQEPISWPSSEDTLKQMRKHFSFASFKLDYLAKTLIGKGKDSVSFKDWTDIIHKKDPKALKKMISYCKTDVLRLEQVYNKTSRFFTPKVNASLIMRKNTDGCPRCGAEEIGEKGLYYTLARVYTKLFCKKCGTNFKKAIKKAS